MVCNPSYCINGSFLCRNMTGVERFASELCKRLDRLINPCELVMYIPSNARQIPKYENIQTVISQKKCTFFPKWDHIHFASFVKRRNLIPVDFDNITPLFAPGIVFIHDIYAKVYPKDFHTLHDKLMMWYSRIMYYYASSHAKKIATVSEFSREQIAKTYHIDIERICVIHNGWEHFKEIQSDDSVFADHPCLMQRPYYFTLGSISRRKNLAWIASHAELYPKETFAVSGKAISGGLVPDDLKKLCELKNVVLLGYVSDGQVKSLMKRCKAFVFPSYYEGFGIPPLEAISCGVPIIISNAACLPEIYGNAAHYIDPNEPQVDLDSMLKEHTDDPSRLLKTYSYDTAAQKLHALLQ